MKESVRSVSGVDLFLFAQGRPSLWSGLHGVSLKHEIFGSGVIQEIQPRVRNPPLIVVKFNSNEKTAVFNPVSFKSGKIIEVGLPFEFSDAFLTWKTEVERRSAEESAAEQVRQRFSLLAKKYRIELTKEDAIGLTPLLSILLKIDGREVIGSTDLQWLEANSIFRLLATYHYRQYLSSGDDWEGVKACKYLRKSGLPDRCIEVSGKMLKAGVEAKNLLAAIHTTRGGAYRDLQDLTEAENSAYLAVDLSPRGFHAYNLLGAIKYEQGDPSEGDKYFDRAVEFGASRNLQDSQIRSTVESSNPEARYVVSQYLFMKDPERYSWAKKFFDE